MPQTPVIHQHESEVKRTINELQKIHKRLEKIEEEVALISICRGQRELIIGDRQTGKTAIAIDTIN